MCLKVGNSLRVFSFGGSSLCSTTIHIHTAAITLTQEIERLSVGTQYGITVFACMFCHIGVLLTGSIVEPDITGNRRSMMLAPFILVTLAVLIVETLSV